MFLFSSLQEALKQEQTLRVLKCFQIHACLNVNRSYPISFRNTWLDTNHCTYVRPYNHLTLGSCLTDFPRILILFSWNYPFSEKICLFYSLHTCFADKQFHLSSKTIVFSTYKHEISLYSKVQNVSCHIQGPLPQLCTPKLLLHILKPFYRIMKCPSSSILPSSQTTMSASNAHTMGEQQLVHRAKSRPETAAWCLKADAAWTSYCQTFGFTDCSNSQLTYSFCFTFYFVRYKMWWIKFLVPLSQ